MPSTDQALSPTSLTKPAVRGSPRSSVESGASGHSPFLHSLHQRFRKNSSASAQSAEQVLAQSDVKSRSDASKEAKRYILSVVKDTWEYPSIGAQWPNQREPVSYRRREDGLSDIESDHSPQNRRAKTDPYKFENPDAVADLIAQRRAKRRRLLGEEMSWNQGLNTWVGQRDAWTGAVKQRPTDTRPATTATASEGKPELSSTLHKRNTSESTTDGSLNWPLSPHSPTPDNNSSIDSMDVPAANTNTTTTNAPVTSPSTTPDDDEDAELHLPIYPPLFPPTHPLRSRITPSAYPTIYSKVVLQSLSPNIPIPLTDMTRALVEGWKAEGNWPPSTTLNAPGLVDANGKGGAGRGKGRVESAFQRWRREYTARNGHRNSTGVDGAGVPQIEGLTLSERAGGGGGKVRKSISMVKKAFGVSNPDDPTTAEDGNALVGEGEKDIGLDFEEQQQEREWANLREEAAGERDRELNRALLGVEDEKGGDGWRRKSRESRTSKDGGVM